MSSKSLNRVLLIGNVTRDPELRYTPQGNAVCTFGLATNRSWKTDNGEIREEAEFHRLVSWNKLAELCSQLCSKGRKIYVEGRLQTRTFTGSDNAQHTITEIVIDDMILLDSRQMGAANVNPAPVAEEPKVEEKVEEETKPVKKGKKTEEKAEVEVVETKEEAPKEDVNLDDIPF
ncbi:single-stranded DNA-binding protein [Candidatus Microgenomates bacterium]|nr:single-stranded DNA-binding protein [Candidatus Microgenomates bacterium]